ncbi:30S ribosomal protein S6 [Spiroplasma endosymbiont of Aspidapion aeneum]|uniref:30S ribosomal protein S6 n=1 Tax=Spiroplasma endosymbiont of Aspidapion aeneum TaxID=3066276 RepID=UPI00313C42BD
MRKYEIMIILDKDTKNTKDIINKLESPLTLNGGKIIESADWGLRDFSYVINHKKQGYYYIYIVETNPENILEFERISRIDKNVVRNMVINTESEKRYIQTTKLSKTDMSKFRDEKRDRQNKNFKPRRPYDGARRFEINFENDLKSGTNEKSSKDGELKKINSKPLETKQTKPTSNE